MDMKRWCVYSLEKKKKRVLLAALCYSSIFIEEAWVPSIAVSLFSLGNSPLSLFSSVYEIAWDSGSFSLYDLA
jgi:hypothetical protein